MKIIILLFLAFVYRPCMAIEHTLGVKFGAARTYVRNNAFFIPATPIYRTQVGLAYTLTIKNRFLIGLECLRDQRGFTRNNYVVDATPMLEDPNLYPQRTHYSYLSFPLSIGYQSTKRLFVHGNVGICYSKLQKVTTQKPMANPITGMYSHDSLISLQSDVNPHDFSWFAEIGAGYHFTQQLALTLSLRNLRSFTSHPQNNFYTWYVSGSESWFYVKHRVFLLCAGLQVKL